MESESAVGLDLNVGTGDLSTSQKTVAVAVSAANGGSANALDGGLPENSGAECGIEVSSLESD